MKALKDAVPTKDFAITGVSQLEDLGAPELFDLFGPGCWVLTGNLRSNAVAAFAAINGTVAQQLSGEAVAYMVSQPLSPGDEFDPEAPARPAFVIVPQSQTEPPATASWQYVVAILLVLLTALSHFQLGVVANVTTLPAETLAALANPDAFDPNGSIPGMTDADLENFIAAALPVAMGAAAASGAHEVGHRVAAALRGVKLGASYFLPNAQIGTFGAITPIKGLVKSLDDLWDVAMAGPLAGGLTALAILAVGLADTHAGVEGLIPVPTPLFQGSLVLGGLCHLVLGDEAFRGATVMLSPLVIAGWCGVVSTCFNLLPVGQLDGGRIAQASYGRGGLQLTSFFTYVGLALGLLGSSLALPFGLIVLVLQRTPETNVQDQLTLAGEGKKLVTTVAVLFAILVLVPVAPELSQTIGLTPPGGPGYL